MPYGKRLPTALYVYTNFDDFPSALCALLKNMKLKLGLGDDFNVLKLHTRSMKVSFLSYPDFETIGHPVLKASVVVDLVKGTHRRISYENNVNPPILHRKEKFIPEGHVWWKKFSKLTKEEERIGLLEDTSTIGFQANWLKLLKERGVTISGHNLHCDAREGPSFVQISNKMEIRGKTALKRVGLSKPVKLLLEYDQLKSDMLFFDYGCGHGGDIMRLEALGYRGAGWDPNHRPNGAKIVSDVVNLGFVLNVIEDAAERVDTLVEAWAYTKKLLVVSVLVAGDEKYSDITCEHDGVVTQRGTFQKYYEPIEIKSFLEDVTGADACTAGHGVYFLYKARRDEQDYMSLRSRRLIDWESLSKKLGLLRTIKLNRDPYIDDPQLMDDFWQVVLTLGRLPRDDEFEMIPEVKKLCGSLAKALQLFIDKFGEQTFESARGQRKEDILVFMTSSLLGNKIPFSQLSLRLQRDIRGLFGSYTRAEELAKEMMYAAGDEGELELAVVKWQQGVFDKNEGHLYLHRSLEQDLPCILRVYLACAARLWSPEGADIIKLHIYSSKVTFLYYDDFDKKNLPELVKRVKVDLKRLFVNVFDHRLGDRHQLLYFKDRYVSENYENLQSAKRFATRLRKLGFDSGKIGLGPSREEFYEALEKVGLTKGLSKRRDR